MIDERSRSREWILESCKVNKVRDPILMEKTIRAFSLLEALAKSGCPFLFKGGSALMLQLGCTQRLSVDVDVICPPGTDVVEYLKPYAAEYGFGEIVSVERLSRLNVPKTHAKCYYQVSYVTNRAQEKVLLDVLYEDNQFPPMYSGVVDDAIANRSGDLVRDAVMDALYGANPVLDHLFFNMEAGVNLKETSSYIRIGTTVFYTPDYFTEYGL